MLLLTTTSTYWAEINVVMQVNEQKLQSKFSMWLKAKCTYIVRICDQSPGKVEDWTLIEVLFPSTCDDNFMPGKQFSNAVNIRAWKVNKIVRYIGIIHFFVSTCTLVGQNHAVCVACINLASLRANIRCVV